MSGSTVVGSYKHMLIIFRNFTLDSLLFDGNHAEPVGYGDPLIAIRPSFQGIKIKG
jgi:hypothetical protein